MVLVAPEAFAAYHIETPPEFTVMADSVAALALIVTPVTTLLLSALTKNTSNQRL